ncbi:MAG: hypothetical protein A2Y62_18395 [Candidatus Fischerbacteria bacterium RBG_13_37_8]|uniref:DUF6922 domain-containing protein n=1 Tax=Candidatus Fischerbacteria bacterium RBG_13_37_8 TaxID=1817863 RepID=A0A1F5V990_9BACT|nr:MAG: hypothetical protein A2Y62_18395 [Candidatus Fischerbacteria bacterium RBG_13_37_8]
MDKESLPTFRSLFWDTDYKKLDIKKHKVYIIERILEAGDFESIKWLFTAYSKSDIKKVITSSRVISPKTKNFWGIIWSKKEKCS